MTHNQFISRSVICACLLGTPLLAGCSGFFTKYEDPQDVGRRHFAEKDYASAAGAFRTAVKQDPRDYHAQYNLGVACDADGRPLEAIEAYRARAGHHGHHIRGPGPTVHSV